MSKRSESTSRGELLDAEMTSLKVAVRVRPLNDKEINLGSKIVVDVLGNDIVITDLKVPEHQAYDHRSRVHKFSFDYSFSSDDSASEQNTSQASVYERFGRVVLQALLEGYNCCVIAYGQSGSGKTYTMMGMKDQEGLTPRICEGLLTKLEDEAKHNISSAVNISYMEIYNEQVYDLLQKSDERQSHTKPRLRVREHPVHGPFVEGLSTHVLKSIDNIYQLISEGNNNRIKAATYIHEKSSRSHAVFTVHCSQACLDESEPREVVSKLQLVDLAGSEKAGHEFCQSRLKEGASINKSLVTLGNVIATLVELSQRLQSGSCKAGQQLFVPYRDSQLTWLMKDSLGGNSYTFMIAAVSPSEECYSETLSTLRYAQRAKNVLTVPVVNEDPATKIIRNLRLEVNKLRSLLTNADALNKKAVMKPLPNISHLNCIMKKSEKKVDHLTHCWFQKWFDIHSSVVKKNSDIEGESSASEKGTFNIVQSKKYEELPTEITDTVLSDSEVNFNIKATPPGNLSNLSRDSDIALSEKSSSVSSECIILPNEIIFYSKGKRSNKCENCSTCCRPNFESSSLNCVNNAVCKLTSSGECVEDSSSPSVQLHCRPVTSVSLCNTVFKSMPVLNHQCIPAPSVHNLFSIRDPVFSYFSVPRHLQSLPEPIKCTMEAEKCFNSCKFDKESNFEEMYKEKKIYDTDRVLLQNVNCEKDHNTRRRDADLKVSSNNDEHSIVKVNANKDVNCILDHNMHNQIDNVSSCAPENSHKNHQHVDSFTTFDSFENSRIISDCNTYSGEEIQFNDSVTEESNKFVKLLNQMQDGSVETINHCFRRKDSDILSLLSLSSTDYHPFHSLDDFFDDDAIYVPKGTGNEDTDALFESKEQCETISCDEDYAPLVVTDESDSSDAESEFDYLDFTKSPDKTYPASSICSDLVTTKFASGHQDFHYSKFLRPMNNYKENLLSVPENRTLPESVRNSGISISHAIQSVSQTENETIDMNHIATTGRNGMNLLLENATNSIESSCEFPLWKSNDVKKKECNGNSGLLYSNIFAKNDRCKFDKPEESNCFSDFDDNVSSAKVSNKSKGELFPLKLQKNCVLHKRLCNSDGILKALSNNKEKYCAKSYNSVYVDSDECFVSPKFHHKRKENDVPCDNAVIDDSHEEELPANKNSISNFLDFSVQDILDMINGKGVTQQKTLFKKRICSAGEEKLFNDSTLPEEIQKFIDTTEITDADKLAGELLKKQISEFSTSDAWRLKNDASPWNDKKDVTKSLFISDTEGEGHKCYDEKPKQQDMDVVFETDNAIFHSPKHQEQKLHFMTNNVSKIIHNCSTNAHFDDIDHDSKVNTVPHCVVTDAEDIKNHEGDNSVFLKPLCTAVQEVHCEKENALEFFNGYQEYSLDPKSDEGDYLYSSGDLICKTKNSSDSQQVKTRNGSRFMPKDMAFPRNSVELGIELPNSDSLSFVTDYPQHNFNHSDPQASVLTQHNTFGNFNITSLTPIEEEIVDDDVASDISEDNSPNISFQFDSLERPKNMESTKNCFTSHGSVCKTFTTVDGGNTNELHKSENFNNILSDVPEPCCNSNTEFPAKMYVTNGKGHNSELSNSNSDSVKCSRISTENFNSKNSSNVSSLSGSEGCSVMSASGTLNEGTRNFQFQNFLNNEDFVDRQNSDTVTVPDEISQNAESIKQVAHLKNHHFEEINNLTNQVYCWNSSSPSTSSDSITFVFVGKENKDSTLGTNSRSIQSSLFSSVSLDSLEKSSIHQNQASCISPRTLSIDSLVAEELLFQLQNNNLAQQPTNSMTSYATTKGQTSCDVPVDQTAVPNKTNFAASHLSCNQHWKTYQQALCNVENEFFSQDVAGILETEKCKDKNINLDADKNHTSPFHPNTFLSKSSENTGSNQLPSLSEKSSSFSLESNDGITELPHSCLRLTDSNKLRTNENVYYSISDDCVIENHIKDPVTNKPKNYNLEEGNAFNVGSNDSAELSYYQCFDLGNHYSSSFQNNNSDAPLRDDNVVELSKVTMHLDTNNCIDVQKPTYSFENICSEKGIPCDDFVRNGYHKELFPVKELTEENLKKFNSGFEENQEEICIVPPPSSFDVSENNGFSMISNSSSFSFTHHPSETTTTVFSKSTQTDQIIQSEQSTSHGKESISDSGKMDLIERMMDLMAETLKLIKEQYCKIPKRPRCKPRRQLDFSSDSDKGTTNQKTDAFFPATDKCIKFLSGERVTNSKAGKHMQTVYPEKNEHDFDQGSLNPPVLHSEHYYHSWKNANEKFLNMKNKVNHEDSKTGCAAAKKPNFYTLPFDFITSKYQSKKPSDAANVMKVDTVSQTSVDCLTDKNRNSNFMNVEFNNIKPFDPTGATKHKLSSVNETNLKQKPSKLYNSKNHLKHLIEVRRKVVQSTVKSVNNDDNVNFENLVNDPLKSPSSSSASEGYLSSVSSKGPLRQLSEISTDSQESSQAADHVVSKQGFLKHNVRPLDFSSPCYRDADASPDTRWLNTSADSGAFFLDSPGTEKKTNIDEYPTAAAAASNGNDFLGAVSAVACTSSKVMETEVPLLHGCDIIGSTNLKQENVSFSSNIKSCSERKKGSKYHSENRYTLGFQDLDEIGENYFDIPLKESISFDSSVNSDSSSCVKNKNKSSSSLFKNSPRLKQRLSSQELQKLLESIEHDRRLLKQIQHNHVFNRRCAPSHILPPVSSLEDFNDLFYQDCYKSLPGAHVH